MADFWTEEREDNLFEEQPCLYDISLKSYSNKVNKQTALRHIAQRLSISEKEVSKKIHSLRTQYNRYCKLPPSGSTGEKTARQEWILRRLSFLEPHIKKRPSMSNMEDKDDEAEKENEEPEEGQEEIDEQEVEERSEPDGARSSTQHVNSAKKKRRSEIEMQELDVLSAVGTYLKNKSQRKDDDEIHIFCKNLEQKMRRIKDQNILLELEHQLEEACYQAAIRDRSNQANYTYPSSYTHL